MADCKIEKNKKNGKINKVVDAAGNPSTLFQELLNVPSISLNEAIDMYKNIYSEQLKDKVQFQILGEKGVQNLDQIEEATFRTDNLKVAREMEAAGKTPKEIRLASGWEKNLSDKKWRYEIQDGTFEEVPLNYDVTTRLMEEPVAKTSLSEIYNNEELFKAYPKLKNISVYIYNTDNTVYDENKMFAYDGSIYINSRTYDTGKNTLRFSTGEGKELVHEIQHLLQSIEGFGTGSSKEHNRRKITETLTRLRDNTTGVEPRSRAKTEYDRYIEYVFRKTFPADKVDGLLYENIVPAEYLAEKLKTQIYENFAGEVEGRNVEKRFFMSPQERLEQTLQETQDIPFEDQFVSQVTGGVQSTARTAPQITQEIIDKLKENGLSEDVFLLSTEEIDAKLIELGVSEDIRKQIEAWHGSPYSFDRFEFSDRTFLSGESAAAFGAGLYFTDLESIARSYAKALTKQLPSFGGKTLNILSVEKKFGKNKINGRTLNLLQKALNSVDGIATKQNLIDYINENTLQIDIEREESLTLVDTYNDGQNPRNLYKVSLHKGKTPSEYTWLEWDKPLSVDNLVKIFTGAEKLGGIDFKNGWELDKNGKLYTQVGYEVTAQEMYDWLSKKLESPKQASLFLLENGIDGIKYPAESISRGATSDTARGFNYVVFDENAITIEEQIQFQKALNNVGINLITNGFTVKEYPTNSKILDILIAKNVIEKVC